MLGSFQNITHYIWYQEYWFGIGKKFAYSRRKYTGHTDEDMVLRAIYNSNIPPLRASKLDYPHIAEFYIHRHLLQLQDEFLRVDTSYQYVWEWSRIRMKNILSTINQIRLRYWYFKQLNF